MQTILMGGLRWRQTLYTSMWGLQAPSLWLQTGLAPLWLASQCYRGLARGHLASYTWGVRRRRQLPCAVVSIGNLTLGGTGKTPLTMWVARWYQQQGWRVAVLSRGYGSRPAARLRVVSSGHGPLLDWPAAGDCTRRASAAALRTCGDPRLMAALEYVPPWLGVIVVSS